MKKITKTILIIGLILLPLLYIQNEFSFFFFGFNILIAVMSFILKEKRILKSLIIGNILILVFVSIGLFLNSKPFNYCHTDVSGSIEHCHSYFVSLHNH